MDRAPRLKLAAIAIVVAAAIQIVLLASQGTPVARLLSDAALPLSALGAAAACAYAATARRGRERVAWGLMSAGMASAAAGASVHSVTNLVTNQPGGTAAAGPLYLLAIGLAISSLSLLPLLPRGGLRGLVFGLDGLVLTVALFMVAWYVVLGPLYNSSTGPPGQRLLPVLYLGGTVALEILVLLQLTAARGDVRAGVVMAGAMLAMILANGLYLYQSLVGTYVTGSPLDGGWPASYLLVGAAALMAHPRAEANSARWAALRSAIPSLATIVAVIVFGIGIQASGGHIDAPVIVLVVLGGVSLCLRVVVGQHDQRLLISDLADANRNLEDVLDAAPILLCTLNAEGRILLARGPLVSALHLDGDRADRTQMPGSLRAAVAAALRGESVQLTVTVGGLELDVRLRPAPGDGEVRVYGMAVDVSEQRRAEAALRESAAKTRFLAQMSHELRTPLNSVLGFTQMLEMGLEPLTDRQRRWVANVRSSADHLLALINDVLDLTKVSAGHLEFEIGALDVAGVIDQAIAKVRPLAEARGLTLGCSIEGARVLADDRRLEQVLLNLLSNAIKFTPRGGHVAVATEVTDEVVRVTVSDTGVGIRAEDQQRIFEEFTQLSDGRTRTEEGAGLGLPLSRQLCAQMGASLEVESEPGRGSRFTVVLQPGGATDAVMAAI